MAGFLLDVHGLRVRVEGWPEVVDAARRDFGWFAATDSSSAAVAVTVRRGAPDSAVFGATLASFVTPRNVVYHLGTRTVIDYSGRALSVHDERPGDESLEVTTEDADLAHEALYHFLLSRTGRHLDAIGRPRLHALGLAGPQGGVAVLLPSGGGKSTLALEALRSDGPVRLLAEDTPLIDRRGRLHPFPLRLGIDPADAGDTAVDIVERMEFHPKALIDIERFRARIEPAPQPLRHIVVAHRSLGATGVLRRRPRRAAIGPLLREAVVGVGVYQGMEFLLQRGAADVVRLAPTGLERARCCAAGLARATVWELVMGRDRTSNWKALEPLVS